MKAFPWNIFFHLTELLQKRRLKLPDSKVLQSFGKECKQIKFLDHIDELQTIDNALFMMETSGTQINKTE